MKKIAIAALFILCCKPIYTQENRKFDRQPVEIPVTILGTFHYAYPNLDRIRIAEENQVDMLSDQKQLEIAELITKLKKFRPTIVAVEYPIKKQSVIDSLYTAFCEGRFGLPVDEIYQVAFRLAKESGISKVYCIDTWGDYERFMDKDTFWIKYEQYLDAEKNIYHEQWSSEINRKVKEMNLSDYYALINTDEVLNKMQSAYFLSNFTFEENEIDYSGVDWVTAQWYNRNLRIIRNLMRINTNENDRIFILYGNGHHALLRDYVEYNPLYKYEPVINYLK